MNRLCAYRKDCRNRAVAQLVSQAASATKSDTLKSGVGFEEIFEEPLVVVYRASKNSVFQWLKRAVVLNLISQFL